MRLNENTHRIDAPRPNHLEKIEQALAVPALLALAAIAIWATHAILTTIASV
ncbi:hypothetical protein [Paracoccus litorisediminis]|uniref:Uncharacterized protein n=1 Tax=Paracoccus litorisediminis TaxID=2006130 RepID=A0A844HXB3_9RHOB|nr:hypothetical protein [Paracoccus litorisediminis]MTH62141.1 hypothetical protein [Paracoccus litorisediminis]